jgi:hypothetical protein
MSDAVSASDLWNGIDLKMGSVQFHYLRMEQALKPPEPNAYRAVLASHGALTGGDWHTPFYAHLDAFVMLSHSVPELMRCCFGADPAPVLKKWFEARDPDERKRRHEFERRFWPHYDAFRKSQVAAARHTTAHRTGVLPVKVEVSGLLGITYIGGPTKPIPTSEMREMPPEYAWMGKPIEVRPMWNDFEFNGEPLFETCRTHLEKTQALVGCARTLSQEVHGDRPLTPPPTDL